MSSFIIILSLAIAFAVGVVCGVLLDIQIQREEDD